ncbi:hypothetical protein B0H12DRAFT_1227969 [Mycena haematopus]|nr:hypothetical protein B0H12DRAFT_1227969 [Mycena haematopus]
MSIPSLVGGSAIRAYDLPGATTFAIAFALLGTLSSFRFVDKRWRTLIMLQPMLFAIERQVVFTLRAGVAGHRRTESAGLSKFMQISFALGYLNTAETVLKLIRMVIVNTTNGTPASDGQSPPSAPSGVPNVDEPRRRFWYRRWTDVLETLFLAALGSAIIATANQSPANETGPNRAHQIERYASSGIGLLLILLETLTLIWASTLPRIDKRAVRFLLVLTTLLTIPPIYRLVVMRHTTPDVHASTHQALNTGSDKAAFYVVHLVPEWTVIFLLSMFNVREMCQTGLKGDRWWDETPKERAKRERKEREKARKKAEAKNGSSIELGLIGN